MLRDVENKFNKWIKTKFKEKEELRKFLLRHPHKKKCLDELCKQIRLAELGRGNKFGPTHYNTIIEDVARMYCKAALAQKEQQMRTAAENTRIDLEQRKYSLAEEMITDLENEVKADEKTKIYYQD